MQNKLRRRVWDSLRRPWRGCEKSKDKGNGPFRHFVWTACVCGFARQWNYYPHALVRGWAVGCCKHEQFLQCVTVFGRSFDSLCSPESESTQQLCVSKCLSQHWAVSDLHRYCLHSEGLNIWDVKWVTNLIWQPFACLWWASLEQPGVGSLTLEEMGEERRCQFN